MAVALTAAGACGSSSTSATVHASAAGEAIQSGPASDLEGLVECSDLWQDGDPVVTPAPGRSSQVAAELRALLGKGASPDTGGIVSLSEGASVHGRVSVTVPYRDSATLQAIKAIDDRWGTGEDVCVEVPPIGYYDKPLGRLHWELADSSLLGIVDPDTVVLSVGTNCGPELRRLQPAEVTYSDSQIVVTITTEHIPWGAVVPLVCPSRPVVVVPLDEPINGRPIVNCDGCQHRAPDPDPQATPTPTPRLPDAHQTTPTAARLLVSILQAAGFTDIAGTHPVGALWTAQTAWQGDRHTIFLRLSDGSDTRESQAKDSLRLDAGQERVDCPIGIFFLGAGFDPEAKDALLQAAACP